VLAGEFTAETMQLQAMREDWGFLLYEVGDPNTQHVVEGVLTNKVRTIEQARAEAWTRIKSSRNLAEFEPFEHDGKVYDADRERIGGAVMAALLADKFAQPYEVEWTLADNTTVILDGADIMAVGAALAERTKTVFANGVAKRAAIAAAASPAAADAITWTSVDD
jgi:hypothetical protein